MNLLIKSIAALLICTLQLYAMDGEHPSSLQSYAGHGKIQAAQATEEAHPIKENIAQTIIQTNIMPNVLASVIAGYAEHPCKGYMFLVPTRAAKVSVFIPGFLEKYQNDFPELAQNLTKDSVMVDTWVSSQESCLDGSNPNPWHAHNCPYLAPKKSGTNFPHQIPASFLKNLKEKDVWYVTIQGVPFAFKMSQLSHRYRINHHRFSYRSELRPFEGLFAEVTQGLLEPAKEDDNAEKDE